MSDNLTLPACPAWIMRLVAALAASAVLVLAPTPTYSAEHNVFNDHARIDRTQIEVRS